MIPTNDNELRSWSDSFISQCDANKTAWDIPTEAVSTARTLCDAYKTALGIAQAPDTHSKAATTAKKEAKKALRNDLTVFVAKYIYNNDTITAPMRDNLGLPVKDSTRSPIPAPYESPEFFIRIKAIRALDVYFKAVGSPGRARPYGYNGAVISYGILDTPPKDPRELPHSVLATKTPYTLLFTEPDRGRRVYIALTWQNNKGETGPYSQIEEAFIP